jgi:hypothetical protein
VNVSIGVVLRGQLPSCPYGLSLRVFPAGCSCSPDGSELHRTAVLTDIIKKYLYSPKVDSISYSSFILEDYTLQQGAAIKIATME